MTLHSIAHGPRPSTLPARKIEHPGISWAELARREGHMKRLPMTSREDQGRAGGLAERRGKSFRQTSTDVMDAMRRIRSGHAEQIAEVSGLNHSTIRRHMRVLLADGKVTRTRAGRAWIYEVAE